MQSTESLEAKMRSPVMEFDRLVSSIYSWKSQFHDKICYLQNSDQQFVCKVSWGKIKNHSQPNKLSHTGVPANEPLSNTGADLIFTRGETK